VALTALSVGAAITTASRSLWEPDETRYAEVAREMRQSGDLALLRLNGRPYTHKPPMFIWAEAGLQSLGAPTTAAGVVPAFLALLLLYPALNALAAAAGFDRENGALAFAIAASSPLVAAAGMLARMDVVLTLTHTTALAGLAGLLLPGADCRARARFHVLLWLAIGLGVLTKGPVALAMPLTALLLAWALLRPRPSLRPVFVGWGPLLAVAVVLAWLVPVAITAGPEVLHELVVTQSAGRLTDSFAHREPFYFHVLTYPMTGLPWSPLVIVAVIAALRRRVLDGRSFLAVAVLAVVLFFSLVSGKLEIYLLPMFPAAGLLVAASLPSTARRWALLLGGAALTLVGAGVVVAPRLRPELATASTPALLSGLVMVVAAAAAVASALRGRTDAGPVAALVLAGLTVPAVVVPALAAPLDPYLSVEATAKAIARLETDQSEGLSYETEMAGLSLYASRPFAVLESETALEEALAAGRCVAILQRDWGRIAPELRLTAEEAFRQPFRRRVLLVVRGLTSDAP